MPIGPVAGACSIARVNATADAARGRTFLRFGLSAHVISSA